MTGSKKKEWVDFHAVKEAVTMEMLLDRYGFEFSRKGDQLTGPCPIHQGSNTNQFSVNLEMNAFHCFSPQCGAKGNILDFVSRLEDISIREAALMIQGWFDVDSGPPPRGKKKSKDPPPEEISKPPEPEGNPPLTFELKNLDPEHPYLEARGLEPKTIEHFGLGYCSRGMMANRIAIPVHNDQGELVAYAGRTVEDQENPKYKLPPNFKKSRVLFNLHQAHGDPLVLVEGFFDVFSLWQAGVENAVALMGSSLSTEQEALILNHLGEHGRLILMFDGDDAGRACTQEVAEKLIEKVYTKVIKLKEGEQPDNLSKDEIKNLIK